MQTRAVVPLFCTDRLAATKTFYTEYLGFEAYLDCPEYLALRLGEKGPELGFMPPDAQEHPPSRGDGLFYCFEVECADTAYEELRAKGAPVAGPPEDQPWGDRRFVLDDPNGITVYIAHRIAAPVTDGAVDCTAKIG